MRLADAVNRRTARAFERIVCTSGPAAEEFARIGARGVVRAPLGVDLTFRHPARRSASLRGRYVRDGEPLLLLCSRLSAGRRPGLALDALAELRRRGVPARLLVAGAGPLRDRLERRSREARLPVAFLGHLRGSELASCQASADVVLSPGPAETFGLAALEALACGTPVVASGRSALPALMGPAGESAADDGTSFADAVRRILSRPEAERRAAARARAERFGWPAAVDAFLAAHGARPGTRRSAVPG